ncbi:MAG: hypothetical protein QMD08_02750 [Actinomycetota bacterium]|nr:hypothetical protein [Actinomycetota bacterium]
MKLEKSDWILVVLRKKPLDRIHIMKSLFLIWHRSRGEVQDYFHFEPYLYGPYSLEVYSELRDLLTHGFVTQSPHPIPEWANYYLTAQGRAKSEEVVKKANPKIIELIEKTVEEVSRMSFFDLLKKVYEEAPEFAENSVLKGVIKK